RDRRRRGPRALQGSRLDLGRERVVSPRRPPRTGHGRTLATGGRSHGGDRAGEAREKVGRAKVSVVVGLCRTSTTERRQKAGRSTNGGRTHGYKYDELGKQR